MLDRTFGVEIETAGGAEHIAMELNRLNLSRSSWMHIWHCDCSNCDLDGSFGAPDNLFKVQSDSSCGGEVISSPLSWGRQPDPANLFRTLEQVLVPVPINSACGLHVHVGVDDLSDRQLGRLYELVHHYEAALFRLACGRARRHRGYENGFSYCRPLSAFNNQLELNELAMVKSADVKRSPIAHQKYVAANLMPVERYGTVEFRLWETTKVAWRMELFSKLSVALVQRAKSRRPPAGQPVYLGQTAHNDIIDAFIGDLAAVGTELVNTRLHDLIMDQWSHGADWQPPQRFRPLPHYTVNDLGERVSMREDDTRPVVEQYDSHHRRVRVPEDEDWFGPVPSEAPVNSWAGRLGGRDVSTEPESLIDHDLVDVMLNMSTDYYDEDVA